MFVVLEGAFLNLASSLYHHIIGNIPDVGSFWLGGEELQ